jgi:hypothetical protein
MTTIKHNDGGNEMSDFDKNALTEKQYGFLSDLATIRRPQKAAAVLTARGYDMTRNVYQVLAEIRGEIAPRNRGILTVAEASEVISAILDKNPLPARSCYETEQDRLDVEGEPLTGGNEVYGGPAD